MKRSERYTAMKAQINPVEAEILETLLEREERQTKEAFSYANKDKVDVPIKSTLTLEERIEILESKVMELKRFTIRHGE